MLSRVYQIVGRPKAQTSQMFGRFTLPALIGQNLIAQLLLLAATVLSYSVVAMAIANSLFISRVGAGNLPLAFISIGLFSIPAYGLFSLAIDRYSRPKLFRFALIVFAAIALGLWFLLSLSATWIYYILLIVIFFQWDFHNNILYPSLLTDYLTTLEYKRYAPFIGIAQAAGTLLGGGLTMLLSRYLATRDLLLALLVILAIAFAQLLYLENSQRQIDVVKEQKKAGILESLKTFPDLVKGYPLVFLLASSSFLLVIIYVSSEFLWLNIYGQNFDERNLTGFLGLMRIVISLIQVAFLYGVTRPLLQWLGVARLNAVYPLTTLFSFGGLLLNLKLPAGIGLHINGDALYKAINLPVHQLNYNAIPQEFIGRVRAVSDGIVYSIGLTLAGTLLWFAHLYLSLVQITWLAASLTVLLLLVRLPMGRFYTQSLEKIIRSDSINLDDFGKEGIQLLPQSASTIREFISSSDRYLQIKGLELAASLGQPSQFFSEILTLLPYADPQIRHTVLKLYDNSDVATLKQWEELLGDERTQIRATALGILTANRYTFSEEQLLELLVDEDAEIKILAAIAATSESKKNSQIVSALESIWQSELDKTAVQAVIRVIVQRGERDLIPLIRQLLEREDSQTKQLALEAIAKLALPEEIEAAKLATAELQNPEPLVRAASYQLLQATRCESMLSYLKPGLADSEPRVRQQAAMALAAYGQSGLALARESLSASDPAEVNAAIAAIGRIRTKYASDILFKHLAPEFEQLALTRQWQQRLPQQDLNWRLLSVAIADYHQRLIQKVLYILSCLGYSRTVNVVTRILATTDAKKVANAIEVLASINERRFIAPLIPILERKERSPNSITPTPQWLRTKGYKILLEALESKDRWIKTGALIPLATIPSALIGDRDPVVRLVAREIFAPDRHQLSSSQVAIAPGDGELHLVAHAHAQLTHAGETPLFYGGEFSDLAALLPSSNTSMNRLLLLKNIALFKNLTLDELFSIDKALETERVLANQTIYTEASWGSHLYIIADGRVKLVKNLDGKQQEIKQLAAEEYFGEIALFDDAPRWDGAIAITNCTLLKLEKKQFISLISQRPHIILEICRFLSKRVRETDKYLSPPQNSTSQL
ncbi:cyclic nucleotide-binding domain-containing protein [Myxosarcina sp. GI1]|uniref:cyclic nucleotide-binding domain-containing protein n=1 Tax=Myxosarcina sp. GI1 TaxID=1541065 RepID=UPI000A5E8D4F|nr:cyclic nucleotide-binding domain-containing protein [Myxosarcina sp. GI1]